jgi:hypothetical protein
MKSTLAIFCFLCLNFSSYSQSSSEQDYNDYLAQVKVSYDATSQFYQDCEKTSEFDEEFKKMQLLLDEIEIFISTLDENSPWLVQYESLSPGSGLSPLEIFKIYHENSVLSPIQELKESQSFYVKLCSEMGADKTLKNEDEIIAIVKVYNEFEGVDKFYSEIDNYRSYYYQILDQNMADLTCENFQELESVCNEIDKEIPRFKAYRDSVVVYFKALPEAHQKIRLPYKYSDDFQKDYSLFETFMGLYAPLELEEIQFGSAARISRTIMAVKAYYPDRMTVRLRELINKGKENKTCE